MRSVVCRRNLEFCARKNMTTLYIKPFDYGAVSYHSEGIN